MTSSHDTPLIGSLFTGYGGLDMGVAAALGGARTIWTSDIEPGPCAIEAHHAPDVPNLGDITQVDGSVLERPDVICGGSPCFPAGALVLTCRGFTPIERVRVGDLALTHRGRWRPVTAVGSRIADTVVLTGRGAPPVECTPGHPFLSAMPMPAGRVSDAAWTPARLMKGRLWLNMGRAAGLTPTHPEGVAWNEALMTLTGLWLARGSFARPAGIALDLPAGLASMGALAAAHLGLDAERDDRGPRVHLTIRHRGLGAWLRGLFPPPRARRTLPAWMTGMNGEWRRLLLDAWLAACARRNGTRVTAPTPSRALAVGMKTLAAGLGRSASIRVASQGGYELTVYDRPRTSHPDRMGVWAPVRDVRPGRRGVRVWNLSVRDDESYTVDGIAVHNCQSVSLAGLRAGMREGTRSGLWSRQADLVRDLHPRLMVWENVGGALSAPASSRMDVERLDARARLLDAAGLCACETPLVRGLPAGEGDRTRLRAPVSTPTPNGARRYAARHAGGACSRSPTGACSPARSGARAGIRPR